jgi:uncharacterized protein YkwD
LAWVSNGLAVVLFLPIYILIALYRKVAFALKFSLKTVFSLKFLLGIVAAIVVFAVLTGGGIPVADGPGNNSSEADSGPLADAQDAVADATSIDRDALREGIHNEVNEVRRERGLNTLSYDDDLEIVADSHSEDMIERDYFAHDSPSGATVRDRYTGFNIDCRQAGENLYRSTASATDEAEFAKETVESWMGSKGHRENLLRDNWRSEGIGIAIGDFDGQKNIVVTQNFC